MWTAYISHHAIPWVERHLHGCHAGMVIVKVVMLGGVQVHTHGPIPEELTIHLHQARTYRYAIHLGSLVCGQASH